MDYEKLYKEALSRARQFSEHPLQEDSDSIVEYIFPELKESEDEKIRKELCKAIWTYIPNEEAHEYIIWLEKQGEQKPQGKSALEAVKEEKVDNANKVEPKDYSSIDPHFFKTTDKIEPKFKVKYAGSEYNVFETKDIAGVTFYGIEDEPNHIDYVQAENCEIIDGYGIKKNGCSFPTKPIMFSEQKPADKVKPKFHEGEWVVNNDSGCVYQIKSIRDDEYCLCPLDSEVHGYLRITDIDNECYLWTIADARDGDVLEVGYHGRLVVGIVSHINKSTGKVDVCCLLEANNFKVGIYYAQDKINPHPASKERRDILFQKMKEAGYEWDAEKKKLKKLSQQEVAKNKSDQEEGEQKSAWSEEDKRKIDRIYSILSQAADTHAFSTSCRLIGDKECIELQDFLKSLRPQNR
jgi:hypothetical protein